VRGAVTVVQLLPLQVFTGLSNVFTFRPVIAAALSLSLQSVQPLKLSDIEISTESCLSCRCSSS